MTQIFKSNRPEEGWTKKFKLDRALISFEDMISEDFFELEREAIFRPSWLYVGRADRIKQPGQYFTKEIEVLKQSVLVVRNKDEQVRVFHNVCPHRGNKLMWNRDASKEVSGQCVNFFCKFHGIQFDTDGNLAVLTERDAWLDGQGDQLKLAEVPFEIWNGFIFVNLHPDGPKETLREFLGDYYWTGFDGYPFEKCSQRYFVRCNSNANWKAMIDGFSETYHAPTTHALPYNVEPGEVSVFPEEHYGINGRHRMMVYQSFGNDVYNFDYERATLAFGTGPRYPFPEELTKLPPAANPTGLENWGNSSHKFWPNFFIQFYNPGWFLTYAMWPLSYNEMRFEIEIFMPPPEDFTQLLSQQASLYMFMDAAIQDFSLLEATQLGLESNAIREYPLCDHEVLVRSFHENIHEVVEDYKRKLNGRNA